jgi:hypothetical protein
MKWVLVIFISFLVFSCADRKDSPAQLIQLRDMQNIVWEIMEADELALQHKLNDSSINLKNESFRLYDQVFSIHKTSRAAYYNSYRYYQQRPLLYSELMDGVKRIAEKEKKAAQAPVK